MFNSENEIKVTKMAFTAKASGEIFSNVGFSIVTIGGYTAMVTISHLNFGMLTVNSTALCIGGQKLVKMHIFEFC